MSAGHHHNHRHTPELQREYHALLKEPAVAAYLLRPHKEIFTYRVPYTGGSSVDGRNYYGDPDIPKDLRPFVMWHERTEKAFREIKKMTYARAHDLATCGEHIAVEKSGRGWGEYKKKIAEIVRRNEGERGVALPPDLDPGPYRESGRMDLIARNKKTTRGSVG